MPQSAASPSSTSVPNSHANEASVPIAPAPWTTKAESYWMFLTLGKVPGEGGSVHDEAGTNGVGEGEFAGGLGCVMVVRYLDTPVGPYDELLLIPGNFSVPQPASSSPLISIPRSALRITRIYVSTSNAATLYNGRRNWNIPKRHARFWFSAPATAPGQAAPTSLTLKVYPQGSIEGDGVRPFFAATLRPWSWVPPLRVSSKWLPVSTVHVQPPLVEGGKEQEGETEQKLLVGTDLWRQFEIGSSSSRAKGCWVKVHEAGDDDATGNEEDRKKARQDAAKWWPQDVKPWGIGAWMEDGVMDIPVPREWKL